MPHKDRGKPARRDDGSEEQELARAMALLRDPAQVAPVDRAQFGRRLSEILTRALRRNPQKK